jgi:Glutathione-dependent formaldehyde-activating enzyme
VISNQARFRRDQITFTGKTTNWARTADSGNVLTFGFCPVCGSTVYWENSGFPQMIAVTIGTFADPDFPAPTISVGGVPPPLGPGAARPTDPARDAARMMLGTGITRYATES